MTPPPRTLLPRHRNLATLALLAILLLCCTPALAAGIVAPGATQAPAGNLVVARTLVTINPVPITTTAAPVQTVPCEAPSECLYSSEAAAKWGTNGYTQTQERACSYRAGNVAAPEAKYCYKEKLTTLVPRTLITQITVEPYVTETSDHQAPALKSTTGIPVATLHEPPGFTCADGKELCSGTCTDTKGSDLNNCGGCGQTCPAGLVCLGGECAANCPTGQVSCQGADCIDIQHDNSNCGDCGVSCGNRETCYKGKCTSLCSFSPSEFNSFSWATWQGINWMTPVKDQAACGSCWAEASTGATEAMYNIENNYRYPYGYNLNLSEQALVSGCYGDLGSCTGGDHSAALSVLKTRGVAEDIYMPYQSVDCTHENADGATVCNANIAGHCSIPGSCTLNGVPQNRIWKVTSVKTVGTASMWTDGEAISIVKKSILCNGPQTACSGNWWHCVDIIGWQGNQWDANGGWIVRNSWGTGWGSNGIGVIYYGKPVSSAKKEEQLAGDIVFDTWYVSGVHHE
jgi:C1A family cysteine protease